MSGSPPVIAAHTLTVGWVAGDDLDALAVTAENDGPEPARRDAIPGAAALRGAGVPVA
jgi:hypothetical protein